jgi:hypothetical protein
MSIRTVTTVLALLLSLSLVRCGDGGGGGDPDAEADVEEDGEEDALEDPVEDPVEDVIDEEVEEEPDPYWEAFLEGREGYLRDLSVPILDCVARDDTTNPCFHGCIDWHSAVEGVYALLAISRATGDDSFAAAANDILDPTDVAAELAQLESGGPVPSEIPYGYSWFMKLAIERGDAGETDLLPLAVLVADALETYLRGLTSGNIDGTIRADQYSNLSWVVFNLWAYAYWAADWDLVDWLEDFVRTEIVPRESLCPLLHTPTYTREFFPPCLHRARAIVEILPEEEVDTWLETGLAYGLDIDPVTEPETLHAAGINFSRTWGLYALWEATGDTHFRDMYVEHIETHMAMTAYWLEDYMYAHWVPNFGVYSIMLSYD